MRDLLLLAVLAAPMDRVQDPDSLRRELVILEARAESLIARGRAVGEEVSDTLRSGSLTLVIRRADRAAGGAAFQAVAERWRTMFAPAIAPTAWLQVNRADNWTSSLTTLASHNVVVRRDSAGLPLSSRSVSLRAPGSDRALLIRRALVESLGSVLLANADSALARWLVVAPMFADLDSDDLRYHVATTRSPAARACFAGDRAGCLRGLGLDGEDGSKPLVGIRHGLLEFVIRRGGEGAWARLQQVGAPLGERIGAAAGIPVGQALTEWRAEIARRDDDGVEVRRGATTAAWMMGFVATALLIRGRR